MFFLFFSFPFLSRHNILLSTHKHTAPCGGSFSSAQGEIISPNWPSDYHAQSVCTWRLNIPSAKSVHVAFTHFELQAVNILGKCVDYVEIFNGESMASQGLLLCYKCFCFHFVICFFSSIFCTDQCSVHINVISINGETTFLSVMQVVSVALPRHPTLPSRATVSSFVSLVTEPISRRVFVVTGPPMPVLSPLYLLHLLTHGTTSLSVSVGLAQLIAPLYLMCCVVMWKFPISKWSFENISF